MENKLTKEELDEIKDLKLDELLNNANLKFNRAAKGIRKSAQLMEEAVNSYQDLIDIFKQCGFSVDEIEQNLKDLRALIKALQVLKKLK